MDEEVKLSFSVFLFWVVSPLILSAFVTLLNHLLIDFSSFIFNLILPGIYFGAIVYFSKVIKNRPIRTGLVYGLVGFIVWFSPAIYFLPASQAFNILGSNSRLLILILPSIVLSAFFFFIGRFKSISDDKLDKALK